MDDEKTKKAITNLLEVNKKQAEGMLMMLDLIESLADHVLAMDKELIKHIPGYTPPKIKIPPIPPGLGKKRGDTWL